MTSLPDVHEHPFVTTSRSLLVSCWEVPTGLTFYSEVLLQWTLQYDHLDLTSVIMHL